MRQLLVGIILLYLIITGLSLGSVIFDTSSGSGSGSYFYCTIKEECRLSINRSSMVVALSDLGLTSSSYCTDQNDNRPVNSLYQHSMTSPFEYLFEIEGSSVPDNTTGIVLKINVSSNGIISYKVINQIKRFLVSLDEFTCNELQLSYAWIISNTSFCPNFSPSLSLCLDKGLPSQPTNLTHTVSGGTNCSRSGLALITINWNPPNDTANLSHYRLSVKTISNSSTCQSTPFSTNLNKTTTSAIIHETGVSNLPLYGCNYIITLSSYPGGHYSQVQVKPTLPTPELRSVCESTFDSNSQLYNVTVRWEVTPNDCSVGSYLASFVLKMQPFEERHTLIRTIGSTQVQAEVDPSNILPRVYEYTFINNAPRKTGQGYTTEIQPKFRNMDDVPGSWSARLSQKECPAYTPPIPPNRMNVISISNFTIDNRRRASLILEWSPPSPTNGDIVEYQIWIWSQTSDNDRIHTLTRVDNIANSTVDMKLNFTISEIYSTFNAQMRASNHWCQLEFNQCYSNWSTSLVVPVVSATMPTVSSVSIPTISTKKDSISPVILWSIIGTIIGLIVLVLVLLVITICCCHCGGRCLKRDYSMSPFIDVDANLAHMLKFAGLNESVAIDSWELSRHLLEVHTDEPLGSGCFGEVVKGSLKISHAINNKKQLGHLLHQRRGSCDQQILPVAVKKLKSTADCKERSDFLKEIEIMKTVSSTDSDLKRFVVNMLGCCQMEEPILLVIEFVRYGDLLNYLRTMKKKVEVAKSQGIDLPAPYSEPVGAYSKLDPKNQFNDQGFLTERNLLDFSRQISSGMEYLASLGIVHRDLACRNILVGDDKNLKISDFGLSRIVLEDMVYTLTNHGRLPLRWMATESIFQREFTTSSDVWSFGIVLWEICTMGQYPYAKFQEKELLKLLKKGYRLPKPQNCSQDMFEVMHQCWHPHPDGRPTFPKLHKIFDYFLSRHTQELYPYIDMDATTPYTYDHLAHRDISDYKKEEMLTLEDEDNRGLYADESSGYGSTKDLQIASPDEDEQMCEDTVNPEDSMYDKLRPPNSGDHPFLVRLSNNNPSLDNDFLYDDQYWDELEDNCLHPFDVYRMKKLSTITEASCEDYGLEENKI